jgi:arabinose-5-phosphate isomerase
MGGTRDAGGASLEAERRFAAEVLRAEARAVESLAERLDDAFHAAADLVERCACTGGTVLVSGLGKSGLVGSKLAATLSSLGIAAHSVHPAEAAHGDLGRFRAADVVICISVSGETDEVVNLAAILRQDGLPVIAITRACGAPSTLQRLASVVLALGECPEAGDGVIEAPTSTTTATMALGDALALAVARRMGLSPGEFARRHPGGALGGMLRPVVDLLRFRAGADLPLVAEDATLEEALRAADARGRRPGAIVAVDPASGRLTGIFTDGDLRRLILRDPSCLSRPVREVMTTRPRTLPASARARDAVRLFREHRQDEIPVVDEGGRPVGILDVQDLVAMRLVRD